MLCPYNPPGSSKLFYIPMDPETYKSSFSILESKCYGLTCGSEGKTCWQSLPAKHSDSSNVDEQIQRPGSPQTSTLDSIPRQHDNKTQSTVKCTFSTELNEGANKWKDLSKYDVEQNVPSHFLGANRKRLAFSQSDGVGIRNGRDGSSLSDKLPVLYKTTEVEGGSKIRGDGYVSLTEVCSVRGSNGSQCKQGSIREGKSCANQETGCKDLNVQRLGTSCSVTDFICVRNREGETTTDGYRSGSSNGRHFVNIPVCNQRDETSYSGTLEDTVPISVIGADRVAYKDVIKQFAFGRSIMTDAATQDKEQLVGTGTVPLREKIEPKAPDTKPMNLTLECKHPGEIVCHPEKMMCAEVKDDRDRRLLEALDRICNLLHVSPIRSNIEHRGTRGARVCKVSSQADSSIATLESAKLGRCQYRANGERNALPGQRELEAQQTNDGYPPSCLQRQHDFKICELSSEQKALARNFGETCQTYSSCKDFGNITGHRFAKSTWEIAGRPGAKEGGRIYKHLPRGGAMDRLGGSEHCPERGKEGAKWAVGESVGDDRAGRFTEKESKESPSALSVTSGLQVQSRGIQVDEGQLGPCPRPHTQDAGFTCPSPQTTNRSAFPVCLDMENITKPKTGKAASWFVPLNNKGISSNSHTCKLKIASCTPFEQNHGSSFEHMAMTNDELGVVADLRQKPMTLQEALRLNRPWLLSRSRERVRCLALIHAERRFKVALDEERRRLFAPCSGCTAKMAESGILTPGKQKLPRKRKILRKEAIFRSRLLYEQLPEMVRKKKQQQQEEMSRLYRLKALQFTQKVTNRVLGRSKAWE